MRAARYYGKEDIRIETDVAEAKCGAGEVRVAPAYVGICGTDLHEFLGGPNFAPTTPHPCTNDSIPITLGHEFSGVITELGPDVDGFTVGQQCVVQPTISCGTCHACIAGCENVCYNGGFIGLSGGGGGLSENVVVPQKAIIPLPPNIPLDIGALVEPLSVAWHAVSAAPLDTTHTVARYITGVSGRFLAVNSSLRGRIARRTLSVDTHPLERDSLHEDMSKEWGSSAPSAEDCFANMGAQSRHLTSSSVYNPSYRSAWNFERLFRAPKHPFNPPSSSPAAPASPIHSAQAQSRIDMVYRHLKPS